MSLLPILREKQLLFFLLQSFQSALCVPHGSGDEAGVWFTREPAQMFHPGHQDCRIQVQTKVKVAKDAWRRRRRQKSELLKESL